MNDPNFAGPEIDPWKQAAGDFLRKDAVTPHSQDYLAAGIPLRITTNFAPILQSAEESFEVAGLKPEAPQVQLRLWVDAHHVSDSPSSKPFFRGLNHLFFAGYDNRNSVLIDLSTRLGLGCFTTDRASDSNFWKTLVFPVILTVAGPSVGLSTLHCACVAWMGSGLLLAGDSGSGKSTLSLALAQAGFGFLSDDRIALADHDGRLLAWSLMTEAKLPPDAAIHFSVLEGLKPDQTWNGQDNFHFDPGQLLGVNRVRCCEPRWLVFLERQAEPGFSLIGIAPEEAAHRIEQGLHRETPQVMKQQRKTIARLLEKECCLLRYGGSPHTVAGALHSLVSGARRTAVAPRSAVIRRSAPAEAKRSDPLRRFTPTPHASTLHVMGRAIQCETNSPAVLERVTTILGGGLTAEHPQFQWRIVCEHSDKRTCPWPAMTAFSDCRVRYVNLGQRSFIAVDLQSRLAVGIVPEYMVEDVGFSEVFLATIFYLTAAALGLVPVTASCVAQSGRGVLLFGPPASGKTTCGYLASRQGLKFLADQALFLEISEGKLCGWGDFWPVAFRPESVQIFPELQNLTRPFHYLDRTFLCLEKEALSLDRPQSITPAASIFLDRQAGAAPKLTPLTAHDLRQRFVHSIPFKDDAGSEQDRQAVFQVLSRLPAYRLRYGSEPSVALQFIRSVMNTSSLIGEFL